MPPRQTREGVDAMGRGRSKAKQTKVARELKYYSPSTDLSALERELHGPSRFDIRPERVSDTAPADDDEDGYDDNDTRASGER
jgi:Protein of unknown function (DUF3073).